jgi:hypothetical protein
MATFLTNALLYHPLRHPHMVHAISDFDPESAPSLIPCSDMPYSRVTYVDAAGTSHNYEMEFEQTVAVGHRLTQ